ncbi:uncharacterized protein EV422DRAFT_536298 [Fimicolochytrium jonesii]|uniref:uncharacterized protein n=1 Tax=Fimicolochytrium jonesii TaxID=1396493 RepID=UPI0022FE5471|nr:uncharacterized protein EV422DRAFT_536298 [Fimicolochytrium jonesii]KAI8819003.1 hypothetical protein EV422DRAFT_536298 [Fimicolochytrium jonesii]
MAMLIRSIVGEEVCLDAGGMVRVLCMFSCNSISICDEELVNIGVGIYPTLSLINHSCVPNTALIFSGSTATLRSIREIRPGEEICQSYTEVADPESVRRRGLREAYFFECCCEGCVGEGVKTADPRTSYICPLPRCPGVLFPISQPHNDHSIRPDSDDDIESEDPTTYHCTTHGPLLAPHLSTFLTNLTHARKQFYTPGSDLPASAPRPPIPHLESSLKLWSTLAPPTHHLRIALHRALQAAHLSTGNLRAALVHAEMLAGAYAEIYNPRGGTYHPAVSVQRYLAFTLRFTIAVEEDGRGNGLNEDEEGLRGLARDGREVVRLLGVSHGEASALWREARGRGEEVEVRLRGRGF